MLEAVKQRSLAIARMGLEESVGVFHGKLIGRVYFGCRRLLWAIFRGWIVCSVGLAELTITLFQWWNSLSTLSIFVATHRTSKGLLKEVTNTSCIAYLLCISSTRVSQNLARTLILSSIRIIISHYNIRISSNRMWKFAFRYIKIRWRCFSARRRFYHWSN